MRHITRLRKFALLAINIALGLAACGQRNTSAFREAKSGQVKFRIPLPDLKLGAAPNVPTVAFDEEIADNTGTSGLHHTEVSFPNLTRSDYDDLRAAYNAADVRDYDGLPFSLTDFMPRLVQATVKTAFIPERFERRDARFGLSTNCWGTAFEFVRADPEGFFAFFAPAARAGRFFASDTFSRGVKEFRPPDFATSTSVRNQGLKFGDILTIYLGQPERDLDDRQLFHAAVYIDHDLYYEKSGYDGDQVYRIVRFKDLIQDYPPESFRYLFRRFDLSPLPEPDFAFAKNGVRLVGALDFDDDDDEGRVQLVRKVFYTRTSTGQFTLSPEAYRTYTDILTP